MRLVEILARELEKWPEGTNKLSQTFAGMIFYVDSSAQVVPLVRTDIATDWRKIEVTREMWQAERERIAKPGKKANAEGWIRNRGRKCPVQSGTLVDLKLRGGVIHIGKFCDNHPWIHTGEPFDVMYYRVNKPEEQPVKPGLEIKLPENHEEIISAPSGPLQWRDRILEIDRTVEALEEERVSLIQRLEGEGLQLLQGKVCGSTIPEFDQADKETWRIGDKVEISGSDNNGWLTRKGIVGQLCYDNDMYSGGWYIKFDDAGDWCVSDNTYLKFHSRPSA